MSKRRSWRFKNWWSRTLSWIWVTLDSPKEVLNIFEGMEGPLGNLVKTLDPLYRESTLHTSARLLSFRGTHLLPPRGSALTPLPYQTLLLGESKKQQRNRRKIQRETERKRESRESKWGARSRRSKGLTAVALDRHLLYKGPGRGGELWSYLKCLNLLQHEHICVSLNSN